MRINFSCAEFTLSTGVGGTAMCRIINTDNRDAWAHKLLGFCKIRFSTYFSVFYTKCTFHFLNKQGSKVEACKIFTYFLLEHSDGRLGLAGPAQHTHAHPHCSTTRASKRKGRPTEQHSGKLRLPQWWANLMNRVYLGFIYALHALSSSP